MNSSARMGIGWYASGGSSNAGAERKSNDAAPPAGPRAAGANCRLAISQKSETVAAIMTAVTAKQRKERAAIFKALGHPARLRIVEELLGGECCVCELVAVSSGGWSTVSRHLSVLKSAGVVEDEKRGLQVYYRLALPCVGTFLDCLGNGVATAKAGAASCACGR